MGFFKDFKRDFAQAVNELMPDKDELSGEYDDEDMVNTFDDNDNMDIAPEDLIDDLDDFSIENTNRNYSSNEDDKEENDTTSDDDDDENDDAISHIPNAELISDKGDMNINTFDNEDLPEELVKGLGMDDTAFAGGEDSEVMSSEEGMIEEVSSDKSGVETDDLEKAINYEELVENLGKDTESEIGLETTDDVAKMEDELKALDDLDESDMEENLNDALSQESDTDKEYEELDDIVGKKVNISKDVSEAMMMREEAVEEVNPERDKDRENEDWEDNMSEIQEVKDEEMQDSNIDSILADDTTYITKGTVITGSITTDGGIDIIGTVNGDVNCGGKLILGGEITGNVNVGELYANAARINGEVVAEGSVKVGVGSVIVGNISATSSVIAGAVNGDIDVHGPVIVDSTAVIMGNIKSRSVQINNGAVIEGFCSQCYSEIDVKSFFE